MPRMYINKSRAIVHLPVPFSNCIFQAWWLALFPIKHVILALTAECIAHPDLCSSWVAACLRRIYKYILCYSYIYISMPNIYIHKSRATVHLPVPFSNCMVEAWWLALFPTKHVILAPTVLDSVCGNTCTYAFSFCDILYISIINLWDIIQIIHCCYYLCAIIQSHMHFHYVISYT